jgi:hypothetical protein
VLKLSYPTCKIGRAIDAPCQLVWEFITDTTRWSSWGPSVSAVDCEDRYIKRGSRGRMRIPFRIWVPFLITEYEEKQYWSWSVWGIRATGHRTEYLGEDRCNLIFEVPALAAPYLIICWIAMRKIASLLERGR